MAQVNFTITDELKAELDGAQMQSGAENKSEFLEQMINAFKIYKSNSVDIDIDLSKYDSVNGNTKNALSEAFKHILTTLDANFSTAKQEAVYIATEKKALTEREEGYKNEILKLASDNSAAMAMLKNETDVLVHNATEKAEYLLSELETIRLSKADLEKEFANVSKVADQVEYISAENKELRDNLRAKEAEHKKEVEELLAQVKLLTGEVAEVKQSLFKAEIEGESKDKEISSLTGQLSAEKEARIGENSSLKKEFESKLSEMAKDLTDVQGKYNQAVGKLEILETKKV